MTKTPSKLKIQTQPLGELLIKDGIISFHQLRQALEIQKKERHEADLPLGALLVQKKLITKDALDMLLLHPDLRKKIGYIGVQKGLISQEQLNTGLRLKQPDEFLGQLLVRRGIINAGQLGQLLKEQESGVKIGRLALNLKLIDSQELEKMLGIKTGKRLIGEILCDTGLISRKQLDSILGKHEKRLKLGDILIRQGILSKSQYQVAMQIQAQTRQKLGQILLEQRLICPDQLYAALSRQSILPFKSLNGYKFDACERAFLRGILKEKNARGKRILPLCANQRTLQVAICDPKDKPDPGELISLFPDFKVELILIPPDQFHKLADALYQPDECRHTGKKEMKSIESEPPGIDRHEHDLAEPHADSRGHTDLNAEQIVDFILRYGIRKGASDIHLDQDRQGVRLRFRVDGFCEEAPIDWLNQKLQQMPEAVISRIKVLSNMDIAERRLPQDGVFRIRRYDREKDTNYDLDFRVASCPAIVGENISIRILDSRKVQVGLENLNHSPQMIKSLKQLLKSSAGMLLVSGPTGSGKSSTLYAALRYIFHPGIKIITAEDPIEYSFPGIMQTQVKPKIGLTFARLLRSFLRLDPDVILVGEIRDPETAGIAFDAAQTGHLMLSTLHTNDAVSAVSRLLDLNIGSSQIAAGLLGVLAQRLVRNICPNCKRPHRPPRHEWELFFSTYPEHLCFYKGIGCSRCGYTGYKGRTLISELFELNREAALALSRGVTETELKRIALNDGMPTMIDDGLSKLEQTTLSEIIRVVPIEMIKDFASRGCGQSDLPALEKCRPLPPACSEQVTVRLSDPQNQAEPIGYLFERYRNLCQASRSTLRIANPHLFHQLISGSFNRITEKYDCRQVKFEISARSDGVSFTATPDMEN